MTIVADSEVAASSQLPATNAIGPAYDADTVSLIAPISPDQAPLLVRSFYANGDPGPITATLAHVPELVEPALAFLGPLLSPSAVDFRTKEIVILRTSVQLSCRYCVDTHTPIAADSGLTTTQVRAIRNETGYAIAAEFPAERDQALIAWVDEVATGRGAPPAELSARIISSLRPSEVVELTLLAGATVLLNRYASTLQLPVGQESIARLASDGFERAA